MIKEVVMDHNDYFCYTRTKRASKRKLNAMKFSKHLNNSQLSSKKNELQSEINELERDFSFLPDNLDDNPDNDVQESIQDRIKALDLLTSGIRDLTEKYTSNLKTRIQAELEMIECQTLQQMRQVTTYKN